MAGISKVLFIHIHAINKQKSCHVIMVRLSVFFFGHVNLNSSTFYYDYKHKIYTLIILLLRHVVLYGFISNLFNSLIST